MGLLDGVMSSDNLGTFNSDEFGESVVYTKAVGGTTRTIYAVVNRDVMPTPEEEVRNIREVMLICVANSATTGISSTELRANDTITVAYRTGETGTARIIGLPVSVDAGQLMFRVK